MKLAGALGAIAADWRLMLAGLFYAFVVAAVMAVVVMIRRRVVKQTFERLFGAALMAFGRSKPQIPADGPRVPFAAALCIGGLLAGGEYLLNWPLPWS